MQDLYLLETTIKTTTYRVTDTIFVDIVDNGPEYEAYIYDTNQGTKTLMFGAPVEQQSYDEFYKYVYFNLSDYVELYFGAESED